MSSFVVCYIFKTRWPHGSKMNVRFPLDIFSFDWYTITVSGMIKPSTHNALLIFGTDLWFLLALTSIAPFVTASPLSGLFTHWIPRATIVKHWPGAAVVNYINVICRPRGPFCEKLRAHFLPIQTDLDRQITPVFIFCFGIVDTVKGPKMYKMLVRITKLSFAMMPVVVEIHK